MESRQNNHNFWIQEDASRIIVAVAGFMTSSAIQTAFMRVVPVGPYRTEFGDMTKAYYTMDNQHVHSHFRRASSTVKPMTYQMNMDSIYVEQVMAKWQTQVTTSVNLRVT
jgi:hypothetical protein